MKFDSRLENISSTDFVRYELKQLEGTQFLEKAKPFKYETLFNEVYCPHFPLFVDYCVLHIIESSKNKIIELPFAYFKKTLYQMLGNRETNLKFNKQYLIHRLGSVSLTDLDKDQN